MNRNGKQKNAGRRARERRSSAAVACFNFLKPFFAPYDAGRMRFAATLTALLSLTTPGVMAAQTQTIMLHAQHRSGEHGKATLTQTGRDLVVTFVVRPLHGAPQFAHIHRGTCAALGAPTAYEFQPIRNDRSTTTLKNTSFATFAGGAYSIAIHQTLAHVSLHVACGGPIAQK